MFWFSWHRTAAASSRNFLNLIEFRVESYHEVYGSRDGMIIKRNWTSLPREATRYLNCYLAGAPLKQKGITRLVVVLFKYHYLYIDERTSKNVRRGRWISDNFDLVFQYSDTILQRNGIKDCTLYSVGLIRTGLGIFFHESVEEIRNTCWRVLTNAHYLHRYLNFLCHLILSYIHINDNIQCFT